MINFPLPQIQNVIAGQIATLKIPRFDLTLQKIQLALTGTFTKAQIEFIVIKLGVREIYRITGAELDKVNKYKGIYDDAGYLSVDFTERDSVTVTGREVGGLDLPALCGPSERQPSGRDLTVEFKIASGATTPGLTAKGHFTNPQGNGLVTKFLSYPYSASAAGRNLIPFEPRGAGVKRIWLFYGGSDGNVNRVEFKKNGTVIHDQTDGENDFAQREARKVPQSGVYCIDWISDNNPNSMLRTDDARSLELNAYLTGTDNITVIAELLDYPDNA